MMPAGTGSPTPAPARATPLSAARLAAVQALYQMDVAGTDAADVIAEFRDHRMKDETDAAGCQQADAIFFADLVMGVVREQRRIDPMLNARLAAGWRLSRIDSILRAILRSAAYEILFRADVPAKVIINEYVDVGHAFFEGDEPGVVNAILDALARAQRGHELHRDDDA